MKYALIKDSIVANVILAEESAIAGIVSAGSYDMAIALSETQVVNPGYTYNGEDFEAPTVVDVVAEINRRKEFATQLMAEFKQANLGSGINLPQALWVHHRLRALEINVDGLALTIDLMNLVVSGDLEAAYATLSYATPDDMSQPYHWLSAQQIAFLTQRLAGYLGL